MQSKIERLSAGLVLLVGLVLGGCQGRSTSDKDLVLIEYDRVRALQAASEERRDSRLLIVDVRRPEQFAEGHIPGAVSIHLPDLTRHDDLLDKADHIVVYGQDWADARGPAGAKTLIQEGYGKVYDFRGGVELWEARGGDVVQ